MVLKMQCESWFAVLVLLVDLGRGSGGHHAWSGHVSPCRCGDNSPKQCGVPTPAPLPSKFPAKARDLTMDALSPSHPRSNKSIALSWIARGRQADKLLDSWRIEAGEGVFAHARYLVNGRLQLLLRSFKNLSTSSAGDPFLQAAGKERAGISL